MLNITSSKLYYLSLKNNLLQAYDALDEETIADTLEGLTDLHEMIAEGIRLAISTEDHVEALKSRIAKMRTRQERLKERSRTIRQACAQAMNETGIKRVESDDLTVSMRKTPLKLAIMNEAQIPAEYWEPVSPKLNRTGLLAALKQGQSIDGAELIQPDPSLSVRTV